MKRAFYLPGLLMLLALGACNQFEDLENADRVDYSAEYAIPLIRSELTIRDLLENFEENTLLTVDGNGLLHLMYSGDVLTRTSDDVFASINETLSNIPLIPIEPGRTALPFSTPEGLELDRMELKSGELTYGLTNEKPFAVRATLRLPTVTRNGQPLQFVHDLPAYSGSGNPPRATNILNPFSLEGYTLRAEQDSIYVEYEVVSAQGQPVTDAANGIVSIKDLAFSYAEGYLGNIVYEGGRDTILIDFFDNWVRGDVYFEQPTVTFNFENSFGLPTRSLIKTFNVITVNGELLPLESAFVNNGIDFPYPGLNEVGQVKTRQFVFNRENSNIDVILGAGPTAIDYDVDAQTNPEGDTGVRGFITDSSYYKVKVEVDLPLYGRADDFATRDTFFIDLSSYESIRGAEFKLVTENGIPLSTELQGYFVSPEGVVLDSLLPASSRPIGAAAVNSQGAVTEPNRVITFADFPADRFEAIRPADRLILEARFSTTADGQQSVRITNDQRLLIKLGAIIRVED